MQDMAMILPQVLATNQVAYKDIIEGERLWHKKSKRKKAIDREEKTTQAKGESRD